MLNTILAVLGIILAVFFIIVGVFCAYRYFAPRRTPAIKSENAVAELLALPINGVDQWLLIRGLDKKNPVLLFLHGGPGTAQIAIMRNYQKILERYFVVVQWDQRGAGLSGMEPVDAKTFTKEQFVADGLAITQYLRERFGLEKIFLAGHSWGSALGYILAVRHPEYFQAFAGIGQISRDTEGQFRLLQELAKFPETLKGWPIPLRCRLHSRLETKRRFKSLKN